MATESTSYWPGERFDTKDQDEAKQKLHEDVLLALVDEFAAKIPAKNEQLPAPPDSPVAEKTKLVAQVDPKDKKPGDSAENAGAKKNDPKAPDTAGIGDKAADVKPPAVDDKPATENKTGDTPGANKAAPATSDKAGESKPAPAAGDTTSETKAPPAKGDNVAEVKPVIESAFAKENVEAKPAERTPIGSGRTRQDLQDGSWLEFASDDTLSKIHYADGSARAVKWTGNTVTGVTTRVGESFDRMIQNGTMYDRWTQKNGSYWDGKIEADPTNGDYVLIENGKTDRQIMKADGSTEMVHADKSKEVSFSSKATSNYDTAGNITEMKLSDKRSASLTWETVKVKDKDGKDVSEIAFTGAKTTGEDGKSSDWKLKDGKWLRDGKESDSRLAVDSKTGLFSIINAKGSSEFWHKSGLVEKREADGKLSLTMTSGDDSTRNFVLKNDGNKNTLISESTTRDGKTETWERQKAKDSDEYTTTWIQKGTTTSEKRDDVKLSSTGTLSFTRPDGAKYLATPDGKEAVNHTKPNWAIYYEGGKTVRADYKDGVKRTFKWDGDIVSGFTVERPDSTTIWQRTGPDKYKAGNDEYNARITMDREGNYTFKEMGGSKLETIRRPNGVEISKDAAAKVETERVDGFITRLAINDKERIYSRDADGKVLQITNAKDNVTWKRDADDAWTPEALDKDKPFTAPEELVRKGGGEPSENGTIVFVGTDNILIKDTIDGTTKKFDSCKDIVGKVLNNKNLEKEDQFGLLNSIAAFEERNIPAAERTASYKEVNRLFDDKTDANFTQKEKAALAAMSVWHMAYPEKNAQGHHNTCNVTSIRTALLYEEPSQFAKVVADVATTGKFVSFDKTDIIPHASSLKAGSEEMQKPLPSSARTWAGQIWDVTTANVYWQRATTDPKGFTVPKGSMYYDQVVPESRTDSVERLYRYDGTTVYEVANPDGGTVTRHPYLTPGAMNDIYEQVTGKGQKDRIIVNASIVASHSKLAVVKDSSELETQLKQGPWPKIIQVHTSRQPFYGDSGYGTAGGAGGKTGGWHVVTVTKYDEKTKKALVDNSWSQSVDHLEPAKAIPLQQLYDSSIGQYPVQTAQSARVKPREDASSYSDLYNIDSSKLQGDAKTDKATKPADKNGKPKLSGLEIQNQGCIDSMQLPEGFMPKKREKDSFSVQKTDQFSPSGSEEALNFFYRGSKLANTDAFQFNAVLEAKPHQLSKEEINKISSTMSTLNDKAAFELSQARTVDLNGKRVLVVDGAWKTSGKKFHGILADASGDGTVVQEVFYEANAKHYEENVKKVKGAISSIKWK